MRNTACCIRALLLSAIAVLHGVRAFTGPHTFRTAPPLRSRGNLFMATATPALIGDKYCLSSNKRTKSTSGRSIIADGFAYPDGPVVKLKITKDRSRAIREYNNYRKMQGCGSVVNLVDYMEGYKKGEQCLVLEKGDSDLKQYVESVGGLRGKELRDFASAILRTLTDMHSKGLVWTDCKLDNFVLVNNKPKAIDLESAVKRNEPPVDYSPETTPPEIATAVLRNLSARLKCDPKIDMWSYGMVLLHMYTGVEYYRANGLNGKLCLEILSANTFEVDVSSIEDVAFRKLLIALLQRDPRKRPSSSTVRLTCSSFFGPRLF